MADLAALLRTARDLGVERLDAELLAAEVLGVARSGVIARPDRILDAAAAERLRALLLARAEGVPFAHLVGRREFHAICLTVTADVLVPRPETELLVETALELCDAAPRALLDLGTGSGAIALALAQARPAWRVTATDSSEAALAVARGNARDLALAERVRLLRADWYEGLAELGASGPYDLILSNPPYIAPGDPELAADVARFEPAQALLSGEDGLDALRTIVGGARAHLRAGGWLLVEHGHRQADAVRALAEAAGLTAIRGLVDMAGKSRATLARAPAKKTTGPA
ncbi:MAG TPA: peptide chain release factor N(5)-glutamine methyltransferase [Pseudomonadales bacterium]|nr:peptide chain release factor N(5)-glutamine methyltransferase [Pseudomonadales bacterium]